MLILGVIQGIAEFLPISSSGHLVLFESITFLHEAITSAARGSKLFINVSLHVATLIAIVIYLRRDIAAITIGLFTGIIEKDFKRIEIKNSRNIIIASIPAGLIGLLFHDFFERIFSSANLVFYMLIINGFVLLSTKIIPLKDRKLNEIGVIRSILIGFFQAFAIIPGISRSGMTITGGMLSGLSPEESARFSFLMAIPVIAGAGLFEFIKAGSKVFSLDMILPLSIVMLLTALVALLSLKALFFMVKKVRIDIFGYYTILLGMSGIIVS